MFLLQTYFNSDILTLVRNLVTGAVSPDLDTQMAEGVPISGMMENPEVAASRNRCRVGQISLYDGPLSEFGVSWKKYLLVILEKYHMMFKCENDKHRKAIQVQELLPCLLILSSSLPNNGFEPLTIRSIRWNHIKKFHITSTHILSLIHSKNLQPVQPIINFQT